MTRLCLLAAFAIAAPAVAQTPAVDAARVAGVAGERYDGYMGFASPPQAAVRSQVAAINIRRRSLYSNLAASRGASPQDVGITAGCTLLARVEPQMAADELARLTSLDLRSRLIARLAGQ